MKRIILGLGILFVGACSITGPGDGSSEPINDKERLLYQQELLRCYKTGGTRVVKIKGNLHCF